MSTVKQYGEVAAEMLATAEMLVGLRGPEHFLELMATTDRAIDHDRETCGQCFHIWVQAEVAREMLASRCAEFEDPEVAMREWANRTRDRWEAGKYFQLWKEELRAGRDPRPAFAERGWQT